MIVTIAWAQNKDVTGTILDDSGEALIGASVTIKGTATGSVTDIDGNYTVSASEGDVLVISYVGYTTQEISVGSRTIIDVNLASDSDVLEEVTVIGYGSQAKKEITSAVVSVDEASFNKGAVNDAAQLLQGKVAGLSIYNRGGDPNGISTIRMRGISTVGANNSPLVVIDGVIGASLDNVDPNDIESMNVLKDGSAAAIYGSRGSSGVILVTTKKGQAGETKVTYNTQFASSSIARQHPVATADKFKTFGNDLGASTNWTDEVTQTGTTQIHNISLGGGSGTTSYRVALNYRDVEGILRKSGFDQVNTRANISHSAMDDKLNLSFNFSSTNRDQDFSFNEALRYGLTYNPTAPIRGVDANIGAAADYEQYDGYFGAELFDSYNPVSLLEQNTSIGNRKEINYNARVDYNVNDALTVTVNYAQQLTDRVIGEYYKSTSRFRGKDNGGLARRGSIDERFDLVESFATWSGDLGNNGLTVSAGYSFQENTREGFFLEAGGFPNDVLGFNALQNSNDLNNAGEIELASFLTSDRIIATFARLNMTIGDGIFFNASVRREGSTKLGEKNKWGVFPAFGAGIDLTQYMDLSSMNTLKFRVGYGVTGSLPIESGIALDRYDFSWDAATQTYKRRTQANSDLKWEEKAEINVGLDFGMGKFSGSLDAYTRDINDFILEREGENTGEVQFFNSGKINTIGMELALNFEAIDNSTMTYNTGVVLSTYKTTLEEFTTAEQTRGNLGAPGQNGTDVVRVAVGEELGQIWGPVFTGSVDDRGLPIMKDINGDGKIISSQDNALNPDGDFAELGNGIPDLELGWTNQVTYGNWDLNAFFRGAFGHSLVNTFRAFYEPRIPGQASFNLYDGELAREDITSARFSSYYVEKADFLKLDNLTIGYNMDVSGSSFIDNLRISLSGQNLFVITNYTGLDPEPQLTDVGPTDNGDRAEDSLGFPVIADPLTPGIDRRNNYFTSRTFTLGITIRF